MTVLIHVVGQHKGQSRGNALARIFSDSEVLGNHIGFFKADAVNRSAQNIRILSDDLDRARSPFFIDLDRRGRT